jgi:hypothetical protein
MLATPKPPACPLCKGPTAARAVPDPAPGDPPFMCRRKVWFDCAHCARSWECCGICHRGALVEGTLWGDPDVKKLECKGGCGWGVAWRDKQLARTANPAAP